MTIRSLLACLLAAPLLTSCMGSSAIDSLNVRMTQNEQRMQQLSSQVGSVEQVLPGQAEMWAQMQAMRNELNQVRGQLDEMTAGGGTGQMAQLSARVNRLEAGVRQMASELGMQVETLNAPLPGEEGFEPPASPEGIHPGTAEPGAAIPVTPGMPPMATTTPPPPTVQPSGGQADTATRLYDSGMNAFASRDYRGAVKAFFDFTKTFPDHNLASNAHFWLGESYYQLQDYAGAAIAYKAVIEKYPGSGKLQSAMLKQGMSLYYAGKKDLAKIRLDILIKKYPSSPEAGRAKKFMEQNK